MTVPADYLAVRKEVFYLLRLPEMLLPLKGKECKLSSLGEIRVGDRHAVGLRVEQAGRPDVGVFFDKDSGLLLKSEARLKLPDDREVVATFLVDGHKDFDGLKHFTRFTLEVDGEKLFAGELSEVRAVGDLEDRVFAKP
jgi:hypothetical protein